MKDIRPVDTLLDPFVGSGTVLVEGMLAGIKNIYGNDINPLALFLSKIKTTRLDIGQLQQETQLLYRRISDVCSRFYFQIAQADEVMRHTYQLDLTDKKAGEQMRPNICGNIEKTAILI